MGRFYQKRVAPLDRIEECFTQFTDITAPTEITEAADGTQRVHIIVSQRSLFLQFIQ